MQLEPCARCRRHVVATEAVCPFCRAPITAAPPRPLRFARRLSRAAIFAGATFAGCHPKEPPAQPIVTAPVTADAAVVPVDARPIDARPIDAPPVDAPADAAIVHTGRISGRVVVIVDRKRRPIASVQVTLLLGNRPVGFGGHTALDGTFEFDNLAPGAYTVIAIDDEVRGHRTFRRTAQRSATVRDNAETPVELTLSPEQPAPSTRPIPMPYGAPPARKRVV